MKAAKEWVDPLMWNLPDWTDDDFVNVIRQIQADALEAAAIKAESHVMKHNGLQIAEAIRAMKPKGESRG